MRKNSISPLEAIEYGISAEATDQEIAEHYGWKIKTWHEYKSRLNKTNPDLVRKLVDIQQKRRKFDSSNKILDALMYGINSNATDKEIADHFGWKVNTWQFYKCELNKTHPDLLKQLIQTQKDVVPENNIKLDALHYGITTKASDDAIAKHFGWHAKTWREYKRRLSKTYPDLVEELKSIQKAKRIKVISTYDKKIEAINYGIETGASDKEIAEKFGWTSSYWKQAKYRLGKKNPQLVEKLRLKQKENEKRKKSVSDNINDAINFGIRTGASDEKIAKHFGWRIQSWQIYMTMLSKTNPELEQKLRDAQQKKEEKQRQRQKNILVAKETDETKQTKFHSNSVSKVSKCDDENLKILLKVFDNGKIEIEDAIILKDFYLKLKGLNFENEKSNKARNTLLFTIRAILKTRMKDYKDTLAEIKKFVSEKDYGPLYEIKENSNISQVITQINSVTLKNVTSVEVVMCLNQMLQNIREDKVSKNINLDGIGRIRSKIEDCYEKISQEMFLLEDQER